MLQRNKIIKSKSITIECCVDEKIINKIIQKFAGNLFFIELSKLDKHNILLQSFTEIGFRFMPLMNNDNNINAILAIDKDSFAKIAGLLMKCDVEVVVFYFPCNGISFDQFVFNKPHSNNPQKVAITKGLCSFICTWVTNENILHFHTSRDKSEIIEFMKRLVD